MREAHVRTTVRWLVLVATIALAVNPDPASAADATLYELTENLKPDRTMRIVEQATLAGTAQSGTPLCPQALIDWVDPGATTCAITGLGWDQVDTRTGRGTFAGKFKGVVQGDNPVDGPEAVVMEGDFQGDMDFSPALVRGIPYGTVIGFATVKGSGFPTGDFPFSGVFRLPFLGSFRPHGPAGPTLRELFCPHSPTPNPYLGGADIAYLATTLGVPDGHCFDVMPNELSLGTPTVRFDLTFSPRSR